MSMNFLEKNVGQNDKYIRIGAGSLLVVLAGAGAIGAWGFVGLIPIATGLVGSCPVYTLMGKSTICPSAAETHAGCCGSAAASEPPAAPEPASPAEPAASNEPAAVAEAAATGETAAAAEEAAASEADKS